MKAIKNAIRDLIFGLVWFVILFIWDTADSLYYLKRATGRIKTDKTTVTQLKDSVIEFIIGVGISYILMGLMAGIMLHLIMRILYPMRPKFDSWIRTSVLVSIIATILGLARQIITFPTLHSWFPYRRQWAEFAEPIWVDAMWALFVVVLLVLGRRAWQNTGQPGWNKAVGIALVYALGVALLLQPLRADEAVDNEGMNVVLIGVDALRPDRLGHFGNKRNTSPNIDALLDESLIFTQTFSQISRTYPAWTTTMSGLWPTEHGIRDNLPTSENLIPKAALLPQVLQDAGYTTGFATDDSRFSYMVPEAGYDMIRQPVVGLQNFAMSVNEPRFRAFHGLLHNRVGFSILPVQAYNQSFGASYRPWQFVEWVVDGLAELSHSDRFFYAMHSCVLHVPGDRVYPWYSMFGQDGYEGKNRFKYSSSGSSLVVSSVKNAKGKKAKKVAAQDLRIYDAGIRMADDLVREVVDELKSSGLWDNTIVILFSDHGEELWATNLPYKWWGPNHGFHVYGDGHTNVAFSIRFPDGKYAGTIIDDPIRLIDLAPTVADLLGLEWPNEVNGKSVMPIVRGEEKDGPRMVYMETGLSESRYWVPGHKKYPFKSVSKRYKLDPKSDRVHIRTKFLPHLIAAKDRALQIGKWKLIWHSLKKGIRVDLYDREIDPINRYDMAELHPDKVQELGTMLLPFLEGDGIETPPVEQWVERSRAAKLEDKRLQSRMKRAPFRSKLKAIMEKAASEDGDADQELTDPEKTDEEPPTETDDSQP